MAASVQFNIIISGISVSGDIDTTAQSVRVDLGNSDTIGYATFTLQNSTQGYSTTMVSGNATCQIDAVVNGISQTIFRGTTERIEPTIDVNRGSFTQFHVYDYGQELQNVVSPDARQPYIFLSGTNSINILSGEGGMASLNGMDLTRYVSGANQASGCTLSTFMSQYFGISGNKTGSWSGVLFSFKPYISGYTWTTYYLPDASGGVLANDSNVNYYILPDAFKVRRSYGWDVIRKLTRQNMVVDTAGNKASFEVYVGVSGDIHIFTSGSYEFLASGINGQVTFQYYAAGASGANLNNIISAKIPFDTTYVKSNIDEYFPTWTTYPLDGDEWTDYYAYSGAFLTASGINGVSNTSGDKPAITGRGLMSIMALNSGDTTAKQGVALIYKFSGYLLNISQFNVLPWVDDKLLRNSGSSVGITGGGVNINYQMQFYLSGGDFTLTRRSMIFSDTSGNYIILSGLTSNEDLPRGLGGGTANAPTNFTAFNHIIYNTDGTFNSGTGVNGGWAFGAGWNNAAAGASGIPDLTRIQWIVWGIGTNVAPGSNTVHAMWVDNAFLSFSYPFSPVVAFNSGSQGLYGRRYAIVEYPDEVSNSGGVYIAGTELTARQGQKGIAELTVRDNFLQPVSYQLAVKPGQVFVIDAPTLNTGSGQTFFYWKAINVRHEWSHSKGFITSIRAIPWFSGTITAPYSNFIDYQAPMMYQNLPPPPQRNLFMPMRYPWHVKPA